jgi:enoyl-CoA hydratase/carnithine racemase
VPLHYTKDGPVATFTFDNGTVNPLTPAMHKELHDSLRDFLADDTIRCGILTGAGTRAFCAGDDIKAPRRPGRTPDVQLADHLWPHRDESGGLDPVAWARDVLNIERFKPMIGAVSGWCLGQGMIYLLHLTDLRIATPDARFGFPEIAYSMAGAGGTTRLGRQIPHTMAMWMLLTGDAMTAEEALSVHMINRIVAPDQLLPTAHAVAERITRHPPAAVRIEMEAYYRCLDMTRGEAIAFTKHLYRMQRLRVGPDSPELGETLGFLYHRNNERS